MELTREAAVKEHRKMWNWLAEHPDRDKSDYWELNSLEYPTGGCFLCHYSHQNERECCGEDCILDWGDTGGCMGNIFNLGLYKVYIELTDLLRDISKNSEWSKDIAKGLRLIISRTARAIADLPERKENETD